MESASLLSYNGDKQTHFTEAGRRFFMSLFPKLSKRQVLDLPLGAIRPNPGQPRKEFHPDELAD